jgi:type I restriction enzyme M protein
LANPPFGGEEEKGILNNFPDDKQTTETALLFLQLIMRKLKRKKPTQDGGRAAIVVPHGTLFADGIAARIKKQLVEDFNLHTIVRLGEGIFAPYTDIPCNLLFFEQGEPTKQIWYYELLPPADKRKYSKTKPLMFEEFDEVKKWWNKRKESDKAWKVKITDIIQNDENGKLISVNLDNKNPNKKNEFEFKEPSELVTSILSKEQRIFHLMKEINNTINTAITDEA